MHVKARETCSATEERVRLAGSMQKHTRREACAGLTGEEHPEASGEGPCEEGDKAMPQMCIAGEGTDHGWRHPDEEDGEGGNRIKQ